MCKRHLWASINRHALMPLAINTVVVFWDMVRGNRNQWRQICVRKQAPQSVNKASILHVSEKLAEWGSLGGCKYRRNRSAFLEVQRLQFSKMYRVSKSFEIGTGHLELWSKRRICSLLSVAYKCLQNFDERTSRKSSISRTENITKYH